MPELATQRAAFAAWLTQQPPHLPLCLLCGLDTVLGPGWLKPTGQPWWAYELIRRTKRELPAADALSILAEVP